MRHTLYIIYIIALMLTATAWSGCVRNNEINVASYYDEDLEIYPDSLIADGEEYTGTALDIYLAGALLSPQRSMDALRGMLTAEGTINNPGYPLTMANEAWAAAAWEVYCSTGSESWLKEAYKVIQSTYQKEILALKAHDGLIYSTPVYMVPPEDYFPSWMTGAERFQTITLGANVWHYASLSAATKMAHLLRLKAEKEWEKRAMTVRNSINDNFWIPSESKYGQYLYGNLYPILSTSVDYFASPLCAIFGIPTPEMTARMASSIPMLPNGLPTILPAVSRSATEISPYVQALNGIVATRNGDEYGLLDAIRSLTAESDRHDASMTALTLRGIMGIRLSPEGISFAPTIPSKLRNTIALTGLRFREATLDIRISGTGDKIASFAIDSIHKDILTVDASIKGHHRINITMAGNSLTDQSPQKEVTEPQTVPATPNAHWNDDRHVKILDYDKRISYEVYINGIMTECLTSSSYTVTDTGTTVIDIVPVADGRAGFSPPSHICASPTSRIHIPATAITPRRPPIHLIPDRNIASRYIELAARHNTRLTFYVHAPYDGEYFIDIAYAGGSGETALRQLDVNDRYAGTLVCPPIKLNNWVTTGRSSVLTARLHQGVNKLSLTYINSTILLHDIYLLRK